MIAEELIKQGKCVLGLRSYCPFDEIVLIALRRKDAEQLAKICGLCIKAVYAKGKKKDSLVVVNTL